jgi:5-methylcytosine-specific restriction protein A
MPRNPGKPCARYPCPEVVPTGQTYCEKHKQQHRREYDATRRPLYSQKNTLYESPAWRRERKIFLLNNPLCKPCQDAGRITTATEVDHIDPHKGDLQKFWDAENWQSICKPCHNRKTAKEKANKNE